MTKELSHSEKQLLLITRQFLLEQEAQRAMNAVSLDASLERQLGIDSLSKVELIERIEQSLGVQFSDKVISNADTLREINAATKEAKPAKKFRKQEFIPMLESLEVDVSEVKTFPEVLIKYAISEPDRPHIYLPDEEGNETIITYGELLSNASRIASKLIVKGIKQNDTIAIMLPTGQEFFQAFIGIQLAGAIPVPIYPPFRIDKIEEYAMRETRILSNAEIRMLITFSEAQSLSKVIQSSVPSLNSVTTVPQLLKGSAVVPKINRSENDAALIQYTSGSTGDPKGVLLLHKNILANIRSVGKTIKIEPTDSVVSWLPLYHDMGLMSWLACLYFGLPITILTPLSFLSRPERWLWSIHYHRATISAGPNFSYELCVNKINEDSIQGLDLSSWRLAFNGAEAIKAETIQRFYKKFKAYNFKLKTFFPVYGLAENTVALAFPDPDAEPIVDTIDREHFEKELIAQQTNAKDSLSFLSEGKAIIDHEIRIVDDNNHVLCDRYIGKVQFRGPSAMAGYYRNPEATEKAYQDGWWNTGDYGYIAKGDLFITGRTKDLIIKAGRNIYPETIEEIVGDIKGIRKGCVAAFGTYDVHSGTEKIVVVAETKLSDTKEKEQLETHIMEEINDALGQPADEVILAPPHTIPKTSSGKLQRSSCKQAYLDKKLISKRKQVGWQLTKLFFFSGLRRIKHATVKLLRFFYTIYVTLITLLTLFPSWVAILLVSNKSAGYVLKYWARIFFSLTFCPIRIHNKKFLYSYKPMIYCANHASYLDAVILLALLPPRTLFIGKKELLKVPVISSVIKKLGFVTVDRTEFTKNVNDAKKIQETLSDGHSILIFPEGTFTYASGIQLFKSGAFQLAVDTRTPICPVALKGPRRIFRDGSKLLTPALVTVTITEPLKPKSMTWHEVNRLRQDTRKIISKYSGEPTIDVFFGQE